MLVLSLAPAHAASDSVSIATAPGSTLWSVLGADDAVVATNVYGSAQFDSVDGTVQILVTKTQPVGRPDPNNPTNAVQDTTTPVDEVVFVGQASCALDANNACNWTWRVPFGWLPGTVHFTAIATEPNPVEGEDPITDSKTIDLQIL